MTPIEQFKTGLKDIIVKSIEKCLDCMDLAIDKKATETANNLRLFRQQLFKLKTYQQNGSVPETDMAEYLKVSYPYFLYYGSGFFPRNLQETYDKNKDRVYFANSPFSLYARLKELLDYIKYYGK